MKLSLRFWHRQRLPVVLQTEGAECGLACLAMVANYWGDLTDLSALRRQFSLSLKGANLKTLISMATGLNLHARPLKVELEYLRQVSTPCILHWDLNHFVVLKTVREHFIIIHDPATGERKISNSELSKHFTGVLLELTPTEKFKKVAQQRSYSLFALLGRVTGLKSGLIKIFVIGIVLQICSLVIPFYMQWLVDEALVIGDIDLITVLGVGFLILVLFQSFITAVRSWMTTALATSLNFQWLGNAFGHLMKLPLPFFEKRNTADIVSRFGSIQTIQRNLTTQFVEGVIDGILAVTVLIMMFLYSLKLAAITITTVLVYSIMRAVVFGPMQQATSEQIILAAKQSNHFMESVRSVQTIRLFNRSDERRIGWLNQLARQINADLRISKLSITYQTANNILFGTERIIVIWIAAILVVEKQLTVGMLFAFISYKEQFSQRIVSLVDKLFELKMLSLHGDRVADIVKTEPEQGNGDSRPDCNDLDLSIEVKNLSFRYSEFEPFVLKNLSLKINSGECVAITGASGCGKTTLVKIMLGLLEPTEGEIFIGGINLRQLGLDTYRTMIGTVMQDDDLLEGSIADNISFFDHDRNDVLINICAQMTFIQREILSMPMAYNTLVGEIGTGLSGGQKQRILLARALYKQPKILFLDEATSHLDIANEKLVNVSIKDLKLTRIIIAHRPETITMADRVIVLTTENHI